MAQATPTTYTVQKGDTASGIAAKYGLSPQQFLALNPSAAATGRSNDWQGLTGLIQPGQVFNVGAGPSSSGANNLTPANSVISGTATENEVGATGNDIKNLINKGPVSEPEPTFDTTSLTKASQDTTKLLQDRETQLADRRRQAIEDINRQFDEAARLQAERQKRQFAGRATGLVTSGGGFLGATQSQEGVLQNLSNEHQNQINALEGKRASAINEANAAYEDKQFELASKLVAEAKGLEQQIYDRQREFASDKLALAKEGRATEEFQRGIAKDKIAAYETMSDEEFSNANQADIAALDKNYFSGYTNQARKIAQKATKAKTEKDTFELEKDILDMRLKTDAGKEFTLGGKTYTGLKTEKPAAGEKPEGSMNVLDLGRFKELYGIDLPPGTTLTQAGIIFKEKQGESRKNALTALTPYAQVPLDQLLATIDNMADLSPADKELYKSVAQTELKGTSTTTTTPEISTAPVYGKGPSANISIDNAIERLKSTGEKDAIYIKNELIRRGYPADIATKKANEVSGFGIGSIINSVENALFNQ